MQGLDMHLNVIEKSAINCSVTRLQHMRMRIRFGMHLQSNWIVWARILEWEYALQCISNPIHILGNPFSYFRKPFLMYDFATAPLWISLFMRKILFSFLSVWGLVYQRPITIKTIKTGTHHTVGSLTDQFVMVMHNFLNFESEVQIYWFVTHL